MSVICNYWIGNTKTREELLLEAPLMKELSKAVMLRTLNNNYKFVASFSMGFLVILCKIKWIDSNENL